jgi:proteic killer suppression protein
LTPVTSDVTFGAVIRSFRHKGLRDLFLKGESAGVRPDLRKRSLARLDALDAATELRQLNLPGFLAASIEGRAGRTLGD